MPPFKGRMMGQRMVGAAPSRMGLVQAPLDFQRVKNPIIPRKKRNFNKGGKLVKNAKTDEKLRNLRIPASIRRVLPSVKRFGGDGGYIDTTQNDDGLDATVRIDNSMILGGRRGRGPQNKYHIQQTVERQFSGMVWDIAFLHNGDILISHGEGVAICDSDLQMKESLDNIRMAGGVGVLSDGKIVAICRFFDVINIYSSSGMFVRSFSGGTSPMTLTVSSADEIIVSDAGSKNVRVYAASGELQREISQQGTGYKLKWPLYSCTARDDSLFVSDCHLQKVLFFDFKGRYVRTLPLKTYGGNEVLRPHGICINAEQDLFIIDNAIDSIEVFKRDGSYVQTIVPTEEGSVMKPKVLRCCKDSLAVGSMTGMVRLFRFVSRNKLNHKFVKEEIPDVHEVIVLD